MEQAFFQEEINMIKLLENIPNFIGLGIIYRSFSKGKKTKTRRMVKESQKGKKKKF